MLTTRIQYRYDCDGCPRISSFYDDKLGLHEILFGREKGWSEYQGKHYCPECSKWMVPGYADKKD